MAALARSTGSAYRWLKLMAKNRCAVGRLVEQDVGLAEVEDERLLDEQRYAGAHELAASARSAPRWEGRR